MATYQELMSQQAALEKQAAALQEQIEHARRAERDTVLSQIKALMTQHGVTLAELGAIKTTGRVARGGKSSSSAGRKVAPKYRNGTTGDTWSGRGLQPNWLKAALASGRKIEEFSV